MFVAPWPVRWHPPSPGHTLPKSEKWIYVIVGGRMVSLQYLPWRGIAWRATRKPGDPRRGLLPWEVQRGRPEMKKKQIVAHMPDATHLAAMESEMFREMMSIVEHLAVTRYEDGEPRKPGIIILCTRGSAYQAIVKDNDTDLCFTAAGKTLDEALETAALYLGTESAPWEVDQYAKRQRGKKKN